MTSGFVWSGLRSREAAHIRPRLKAALSNDPTDTPPRLCHTPAECSILSPGHLDLHRHLLRAARHPALRLF